jgi:thiamine-phosphate pyrophosphorylase
MLTEKRSERLRRLRAARLYLVTDDQLEPAELLNRLGAALKAGARAVQFRAKGIDRRAFLAQARRVQALCHEHDALFIVNDAADVAALLGADGLHVGQDDLPAAEARRLIGWDMLLGLSVSRVEQAHRAAPDLAVDHLGVGAMYASPTKPSAGFGGLPLLRAVRAAVDFPLVAIGGISADRASEVFDAGADSLAVVSAVFSAPDPAAATRAFLAAGANLGR